MKLLEEVIKQKKKKKKKKKKKNFRKYRSTLCFI